MVGTGIVGSGPRRYRLLLRLGRQELPTRTFARHEPVLYTFRGIRRPFGHINLRTAHVLRRRYRTEGTSAIRY